MHAEIGTRAHTCTLEDWATPHSINREGRGTNQPTEYALDIQMHLPMRGGLQLLEGASFVRDGPWQDGRGQRGEIDRIYGVIKKNSYRGFKGVVRQTLVSSKLIVLIKYFISETGNKQQYFL